MTTRSTWGVPAVIQWYRSEALYSVLLVLSMHDLIVFVCMIYLLVFDIDRKCFYISKSLTLYVSQLRKKLTDPSMRLCMTVQPPGSCLWSHQTCISLLVFSGFSRYMLLLVCPSSRACKQSLNGPV